MYNAAALGRLKNIDWVVWRGREMKNITWSADFEKDHWNSDKPSQFYSTFWNWRFVRPIHRVFACHTVESSVFFGDQCSWLLWITPAFLLHLLSICLVLIWFIPNLLPKKLRSHESEKFWMPTKLNPAHKYNSTV